MPKTERKLWWEMLHKVQFIVKEFDVDKDLLLVATDFVIFFFFLIAIYFDRLKIKRMRKQ